MKAYEIEVYPAGGEVVLSQDTEDGEGCQSQTIRLTPEQVAFVCEWLRKSATVAEEQQGGRAGGQ